MRTNKYLRKLNVLNAASCILIISLFFSACKRDEEKAGWETEILTPLLKSSLSIRDIITDTLLVTGADHSLKVVYENHLYKMTLDSLFSLYDSSVTKNYNLDSISLLNQSVSYAISLGQISPGLGILNGTNFPIPAIPAQSSPAFIINADTLFQTMTLISGYIDISINNGLPIDITNLNFDLKNTSDGTNIANVTFPLIASGNTEVQTVSLAGKTVNGNMTAQILSISSPGSNGIPVLIDTSDALHATLSIYDLHPSSATAIFPAQNLINKSQPFVLDSASIPVELKEAKLKSGQVTMDLYSTLQDSVYFTYSLPSATLNGDSFVIQKVLPPAPAGGPPSHFYHAYDFSGYTLDFSGPYHDTVNTMYNAFIARVDSTGLMKTLSLSDSMYANIGFVGLEPSYGRGYLGQQSFEIGPSQLLIDIFKKISGTFQLQDVKLSIVAENGIGADARVNINNLSSYNSQTNNTVTLSGSAVSNPIYISRATDPAGVSSQVVIANSAYLLDNTNSNSPAFISNLPDKLNYSMTLLTNPGGNNGSYTDFIYADKLMEFNLDVEIPLAFIASNLTLTDTIDFSMNEQDLSRIKDGTLTLIADNGFPFSVNIQLFTLDLTGSITSTLFDKSYIEAASVNSNNIVTQKKRSKLTIPVDQQIINTFFNIKKMKLVAKFNTASNNYYKIYSDYTIDFQLTGDFNYSAH